MIAALLLTLAIATHPHPSAASRLPPSGDGRGKALQSPSPTGRGVSGRSCPQHDLNSAGRCSPETGPAGEAGGKGERDHVSAETALDAERAFDRMAAEKGQWTAFRAFAAPEAIMFVPQPVNAKEWLKNRKDPPASVRWQPTASYASCDGSLAVNTGAWQLPDGSVGYFTTVWKKQPNGSWRWVLDHGDALTSPRHVPRTVKVEPATCGPIPSLALAPLEIWNPRERGDQGHSSDYSIAYEWLVAADGSRSLQAWMQAPTTAKKIIDDHVSGNPAP